jgi:pimeloyl-ACP methyl ester carboxylesterase
MPQPEFIRTNGIRMAVFAQGTGPPVVFCHGFPELGFSWRHQIPAVAAAGFHAIAPDLRGYGRTDRPLAIEAYDIRQLTGDLVGLIEHYGYERAIFVGHDWGGLLAWAMPLLHKSRVAGVASLNTPFRARTQQDPIALMRARFGEDMYIVQFQEPGKAEAILERDVERSLRFFFRKPGAGSKKSAVPPDMIKRLALLEALETEEGMWSGDPVLVPDEMKVYVDTFRRTGFTGGLNWYRNLTRNWKTTEGLREHIDVPCLMIMAENDYVLPPSAADAMHKHCPSLEKHLIRNCGHWTQQEHPEEVNRVLVDWLKRNF